MMDCVLVGKDAFATASTVSPMKLLFWGSNRLITSEVVLVNKRWHPLAGL